jgi:hypothetical protein
MTDTERAAMRSLGERMHRGEQLTAAEFDEYLNLSALAVPVLAAS